MDSNPAIPFKIPQENKIESMKKAIDKIAKALQNHPEVNGKPLKGQLYMSIEDMPEISKYINELGFKDRIILHDENDLKRDVEKATTLGRIDLPELKD